MEPMRDFENERREREKTLNKLFIASVGAAGLLILFFVLGVA